MLNTNKDEKNMSFVDSVYLFNMVFNKFLPLEFTVNNVHIRILPLRIG